MTRASLREYAAVQRERYRQARGRTEKRQLLDEIVAVTGMHRKAVIRWLRRPPASGRAAIRSGRPRRYGAEIAAAAEVLWQASGRVGAHRLHPFVSELLDRLLQCGELSVPPAVDKLVRQASRPTLARLLGPARARYPLRGATTTHRSTWLKQQIPMRTFADWDDVVPGFCEIDLVAHCGSSTRGFYLFTLCAVDIATSWVELQPLWGKGQYRVTAAVHEVRARLPVALRGLDSDNVLTARACFGRQTQHPFGDSTSRRAFVSSRACAVAAGFRGKRDPANHSEHKVRAETAAFPVLNTA